MKTLGLGIGGLLTLESGLLAPEANALEIKDHPSPKRRTRANRKSTDFIILHTTEGKARGSLDRLTRFGLANYMIDRDGTVYRIMERDQYAGGTAYW